MKTAGSPKKTRMRFAIATRNGFTPCAGTETRLLMEARHPRIT
jgi:hypothetical protein